MPQANNLIRLSVALRRAKESWPHITERCIRDAVITGKIESKRTSAAPKAHYMVQWTAVKDYLDGLNRN